RYEGQGSELTVDVPQPLTPWPAAVRERFDAEYRERYGSAVADVPAEVLTWRVICPGPRPRVALGWHGGTVDPAPARKGSRRAYFGDGFVDTPVYDRYRLAPGTRVDGPALVEERESTLVLPPGAGCTALDAGSLRMVLPNAGGEEARCRLPSSSRWSSAWSATGCTRCSRSSRPHSSTPRSAPWSASRSAWRARYSTPA